MWRNFKLIFNELLSISIRINNFILRILRTYTNFNLKISILNRINRIKFCLFAFFDNYTSNI